MTSSSPVSQPPDHAGRETGDPHIDFAAAVRGASRGFTVLVLGGVLSPLVAGLSPNPALSQAWVLMAAAAGFAVAGSQPASTRSPWLHGAACAAGSFFLLLPLWLLFPSAAGPGQIVLTLALALTVGSSAGATAHLIRTRRTD